MRSRMRAGLTPPRLFVKLGPERARNDNKRSFVTIQRCLMDGACALVCLCLSTAVRAVRNQVLADRENAADISRRARTKRDVLASVCSIFPETGDSESSDAASRV